MLVHARVMFINYHLYIDYYFITILFQIKTESAVSLRHTHLILYHYLTVSAQTVIYTVFIRNVRMAERSKALRSGRSLVLQAWVRIPLLTNHFYFLRLYIHRHKRTGTEIKSFPASQVWFQAVAVARTYGTDSPVVPSQPR